MTAPTSLPMYEKGLSRMRRAFAFAVVAAAVAGCALAPREAPVKHTFLLDPAMPRPVAQARPQALRVGTVNVSVSFRGKSFVVRSSAFGYESDYYDEFFVPPSQMLAEATTAALTASGVFRRVAPPGAAVDDADYVLDGFASELYADLSDPANPVAVITITYYLSAPDGRGVVWSKEYSQRVGYGGGDPAALARAWSKGLSAIFAELARDLVAAKLPAS